MTILQIGFEPIRHIARRFLTHADTLTELGQVTITSTAPQRQALLDDLCGQVVVAGERTCRDERRGRVEIGCGEIELLVEATNGVTELHTRVPQRIPDRAGDRLDLFRDLLRFHIMDEQEVEVALRRQLAAAVSADRQQRHPAGGSLEPPECLVEDGHHPVVGDLGERPAVVATRSSDACGNRSEVLRTNRRRHETTPAAGPIDA